MQQHLSAPPADSQLKARATATPEARRALASGTLGSALEWFDFAIYGALSATVFPQLFFHQLDPAVGILASFATFGVGFFARPLGGMIFGHLGDRFGRRRILLVTFITMGLASLVIGLLPSYAAIGLAAPLILVLMRFIQGFALGGEATGAQLMTMEHAPQDRRAFYGALMAMGSPLSQVLANLSLVLLSMSLDEDAFLQWGWRLPFLLSILLVVVGIYIRFKVEETPLFQQQVEDSEEPQVSPLSVLKSHGLTIARLILAFAPIVVTFYVVSVFGISYLTKNAGFDQSQTFAIVMVANLLSVGAIAWGGRVADVIGRRKVLLIGGGFCLAAGLVFFPVVDLHNFPLTLAIVSIALCGAQFGNAGQAALYAEAFPTKLRYTGSALALTGANLIFAAPAPLLASWLMGLGSGTAPVTITWVVIIAAALVNLYLMRDGKTLEGTPQHFR
ncbi:MHS family MFS transporter [Arthrobacter sp. I2-34]|uniref:MHS family MFS transporter n=1 Tax=Arthrobacter hankyongi TaxID=2904801 RepID=A0ABS9LA81_9MICC|nr:MFS transporter [Arthrobacter hankyongi]MCG2623369.1 MHS family MFS transporter [Arthrobacter hankyongi]